MSNYAFDPTGVAVANRVTSEVAVINGSGGRDYNFYIPKAAPFYEDGFVASFTNKNGVTRQLVPGVDFHFTHIFKEASLSVGKSIYGSMTFVDKNEEGVLTIGAYQTIGGIWVIDPAALSVLLATNLANPRTAMWAQITELPASFPVVNHDFSADRMVAMTDVVLALAGIEAAIRNPESDETNPSTDIELLRQRLRVDKLPNYPAATDAQMIAGLATEALVNPKQVVDAIARLAVEVIEQHVAATGNVHHMTADDLGAVSAEVLNRQITALLAIIFDLQDQVDTKMDTSTATQTINGGTANTSLAIKNSAGNSVQVMAMGDTTVVSMGVDGTASISGFAYDSALKTFSIIVNGQPIYSSSTADALATTAAITTAIEALVSTYFTNGRANDSAKLGGQSLEDVITTIRQSISITNASTLEGKTVAQIIAEALQGTAANSTKFGNKSYAEAAADITTTVMQNVRPNYFPQRFVPVLGTGVESTNYWTKIATIPGYSATAATPDVQLFVAAANKSGVDAAALYYVGVSANNIGGHPFTVNIIKLTDEAAGALTFGTRMHDTENTIELYIKQGNPRSIVSISQISKVSGVLLLTSDGLTAEPTNMTYYTAKAIGADYSAQITALTDRVTALETSLAQTIEQISTSMGGTTTP